jgi:aromatic-L-amino-acid decarboxylase
MDPADFRRHAHALADWIAAYIEQVERYPVVPRVAPGDVRAALPRQAPEQGEPFEAVLADFERVLVPALTHWNHPCFVA